MTRKSRIEMKDDHRNGNNQKFGKHSACHKIHQGSVCVSLEWPLFQPIPQHYTLGQKKSKNVYKKRKNQNFEKQKIVVFSHVPMIIQPKI